MSEKGELHSNYSEGFKRANKRIEVQAKARMGVYSGVWFFKGTHQQPVRWVSAGLELAPETVTPSLYSGLVP